MIFRNFIPLRKDDADADAGSGGKVDRGDELQAELDTATPDAAAAEAAAAAKLEKEVGEAAAATAAAEAAAAAAAEAEGDEKDPKKKDSRVPLARHEAILAKERQRREDVERELAQFQHGSKIADVNAEITAAEKSIITMEKEYATLLTDGEVDKATAVMQKIRAAERDMAEAKSDMKIQAAEIRATERARYNTALERVEQAFPTLNPDHADYDEDAMAEVADLKSAYEMKGLTPTAALQKAVKMIVEPRTTRQEIATTTKPNVSDKDIAAERKTAAVAKVVEATTKTPPNLEKVGLDSDKMGGGALDPAAVIKLGQKEFAALSDATLSQMRGDTL